MSLKYARNVFSHTFILLLLSHSPVSSTYFLPCSHSFYDASVSIPTMFFSNLRNTLSRHRFGHLNLTLGLKSRSTKENVNLRMTPLLKPRYEITLSRLRASSPLFQPSLSCFPTHNMHTLFLYNTIDKSKLFIP